MHIRASEWFEQNGDIGEAFQHAMSPRMLNALPDWLEAAG
jgi:ATP/maltotriose-dependent transcriptional regulator MalT